MSIRGALSDLWSLLWIDYVKLGEEFHAELQRRGVLALRIVSSLAVVQPLLVVTLFWPFAGSVFQRGGGWLDVSILEEATAFVVGIVGLGLSHTGWGRGHARDLAVIVGLALALIVTADMITSGYTISVYAALVMGALLAVALLLVVANALGAGLAAVMTRLRIREHENRDVLAESLDALRRTQANLIASTRAASQGRLAAAISHELNTPLSVLLSSSELIERHLSELACKCEDPKAVELSVADAAQAAARSREALNRITDLVDRFERFTQLDSAERRLVDVNALLDDTVGVLSGGWSDGLMVTKDYGEVPEVPAYPKGLSEVFGNVLSNAAGAIDGEGEIKITTRFARGYVWVQISDTGRGIDTEDLSTIFDPTFRVDNGRVRTGWGLFISRQIIHDHHGDFRINSEAERGTEVEICLPAGARDSAG